jgi:hypothetical protein
VSIAAAITEEHELIIRRQAQIIEELETERELTKLNLDRDAEELGELPSRALFLECLRFPTSDRSEQ